VPPWQYFNGHEGFRHGGAERQHGSDDRDVHPYPGVTETKEIVNLVGNSATVHAAADADVGPGASGVGRQCDVRAA